jgi:hypothetical protein
MNPHTLLVVAGIALLVIWRLLFGLSVYSARFSPLRDRGPLWLVKWTSWLAPTSSAHPPASK